MRTNTRLDRQVAIKALPEHLSSDAERLARFQREAKILASLNHPNIGAIYGIEEANGQQYLVLEYIEGEPLDQRISRGPLPLDDAIEIAVQVADALESAHEKGVIHRDLKPATVMVRTGAVNVRKANYKVVNFQALFFSSIRKNEFHSAQTNNLNKLNGSVSRDN